MGAGLYSAVPGFCHMLRHAVVDRFAFEENTALGIVLQMGIQKFQYITCRPVICLFDFRTGIIIEMTSRHAAQLRRGKIDVRHWIHDDLVHVGVFQLVQLTESSLNSFMGEFGYCLRMTLDI